MLRVDGDFGSVVLSNDGASRSLSIPTGSAVEFFKGISVKRMDVVADALGMYSIRGAGRAKDIVVASFGAPKNVFHKRAGGCQWNPQGKTVQKSTRITLDPFEYNGEECPDAEWGDCLNGIFAPGLGNTDYYSTPEATALITELIEKIYVGLGNSFFDAITWGKHPLIDTADAAGSYDMSAADWADFKKNHDITSGHMTIVDGLKAAGLPNFNVQILQGDTDGTKYTGSVTDLFENLEANETIEMKAARRSNPEQPSIISVTPGIFQKYKKELIAQYNGLPETYLLQLTGADGRLTAPGALYYNGRIVVERLDWGHMYEQLGIVGHRAMIHTPGVFAIGLDIDDLMQFEGMGLRVDQWNQAPYLGKIFMYTMFKAGAAVLDEKHVVNASLHLT